MVDFHAHVLPYVDDGADDIVTAVKMLALSKSQGVETVVATPHFNHKVISIDDFLKKREESFKELQEYIIANKVDVPEIKLGAEVCFSHELLSMDLEKLAIEGTDTILIELPFSYWNEWVYQDLFELSAKHKLNVIVAHLERYVDSVKDLINIKELFDMNVLIQVNADSFLLRSKRKIMDNMVKRYHVDLIGTDMHNLDTRTTNMDKAFKVMSRRYGKMFLMNLNINSNDVFNGTV